MHSTPARRASQRRGIALLELVLVILVRGAASVVQEPRQTAGECATLGFTRPRQPCCYTTGRALERRVPRIALARHVLEAGPVLRHELSQALGCNRRLRLRRRCKRVGISRGRKRTSATGAAHLVAVARCPPAARAWRRARRRRRRRRPRKRPAPAPQAAAPWALLSAQKTPSPALPEVAPPPP